MNKKDLRIVFLGTPDFAVASLAALVEADFNVVGVVTMPDKPAGRGHKLQESAVKQYAVSNNLKLLQPTNLKDESFLYELKALNANLQIVVAFRMLPEAVWNMPELGTFNLHGSLLPQYRGAAPINWAVMNGEIETGVTTFFLKHEIDTGDVILQERIPIKETDNVGDIYNQLMNIGANLVVKTCDLIIIGNYPSNSQTALAKQFKELKTAPKIYKETCLINWNNTIDIIYNQIRGLSPYPAAWFNVEINNKEYNIKVFSATKEKGTPNKSGELITDNKTYIKIAAVDGYITLKELQLSGKKKMSIEDLLRGTNFENAKII